MEEKQITLMLVLMARFFFGHTSHAFHNKRNYSQNRYGNVRAAWEAMKIMRECGLSLPPAEFEEASSSLAGKINAL